MQTFLDSADDMEWLRATCLRGVTLPTAWHDFASAVLHGNEDAPERIDLYLSREPAYTDSYLRVTFDHAAPVYCEYSIVTPDDCAGEHVGRLS